jgi:hypothetical protein
MRPQTEIGRQPPPANLLSVGLWVNDPKHDDARCIEPAA